MTTERKSLKEQNFQWKNHGKYVTKKNLYSAVPHIGQLLEKSA